MKFAMKTLALTLGLLAKMNTSVTAEKVDVEAVMTEIGELKSSGEWPKGASTSTIAYLTSIGQWPSVKTSERNTGAIPISNPSPSAPGKGISIPSPPSAPPAPSKGFAPSAPSKGFAPSAPSKGYLPSPAPNDFCEDATEITSLPFTSEGDTTDATAETGIGNCGVTSNTDFCECGAFAFYDAIAKAVWYKVTGTGGSMTAETIVPSNFDTKLHVYSGTCGDFTWIDGNDDIGDDDNPTSNLSKVTWDSVPCEEYYILVHAFETATGKYKLEVTTSEVADLDCSEAPSMVPSSSSSSLPSSEPSMVASSEPSWVADEQCKKKDLKNDVCAKLDGRCKVDCEDDEDFVCVPGLCSYDRNWDKPTKSPKMRALMDKEEDVVDIEITAEGGVERKLKATKAPSKKGTKATKGTKSSCACRVAIKRG